MATLKPALRLYNHHPEVKGAAAPLPRWRSVATRALPKVKTEATAEDAPLLELEEVEITFVNDDAIAAVHGDFMNDPTPTDVITFHHGEILISLDTAKRQAAEHGQPWEKETALYVIHGLLHLAGWDDREEEERKQMHAIQERILGEVWEA
jgi:probable rRNA maturation factor